MDTVIRNVILFVAGICVVLVIALSVHGLTGKNSLFGTSTTAPSLSVGNVADNAANTANTGSGDNVQLVSLKVVGGTYVLEPNVLKKGVPVKMTADLSTVVGCSRDIVISAFNVRKYVSQGDNVITFTPDKDGAFGIACSMNMYRGSFTVTDDGNAPTGATAQQAAQLAQQGSSSGGSCGASGGGCGCGG